MPRTISIGAQGYEDIRTHGDFYVDKTDFIRDWWNARDEVTLLCRPRRFGKTLNLDMVRSFLSTENAGRGEELFSGLAVWNDPAMQALQGTMPVVSLSFAGCKGESFAVQQLRMREQLASAWRHHARDVDPAPLDDTERAWLAGTQSAIEPERAATSLQRLCELLHSAAGKDVVVLLDEYDTPMQEAWLGGWWNEAAEFQRALFNNTFKTNDHLARGLITGVTRMSRESIFSDLNNLEVCSMRTGKYETSFGFTQDEVDAALAEFGLAEDARLVRKWYDGFTVGDVQGIYNPWSITKFLSSREFDTFWANTSSNGLVSSVLRGGGSVLKVDFEALLRGEEVEKQVDEQVVFSELSTRPDAVWGMLVASGYLKMLPPTPRFVRDPRKLKITNYETELAFDDMVRQWFVSAEDSYNGFVKALLADDVEAMDHYLSDVLVSCISSFDGATKTAESEPERFYHGLVLGLLVELRGRYAVESNRESGFGRYDVMLVPTGNAQVTDPAIVIEFKVFDPKRERFLEDTVTRARAQIESKAYTTTLVERGFAQERIRTYGVAFRGKECLVG